MAKDLSFRVRFKAVDKLSAQIDKVSSKFPKLSRSVTRSNNAFKILQIRTAKIKRNLKAVGSSFQSAGTKLTAGLTVPLLGLGVMAIKTTANFQAGMNKVQALTGATGGELDKLSEQARNLGSTTAFSANQATEAMAFFGQAGFNTNQILKATPATLDLAAASSTDLARSADILSNVMGGFQIKAGGAGDIADILAKATAKGNINMEMLGETMKQAGPVAQKFGSSIAETAALTAKLGDAGIQGSLAGTTLKNMFLRLAAPTSKISGALKNIGVSTKDANGKLKPMTEILVEMNKQFSAKGLGKAQKLKVLNDIFGLRAVAGAAVLVEKVNEFDKKSGKSVNTIKELTKGLEDSTGAAKEMAETMLKGLPGAIVKLKSAFEGLLLKLGVEGGLAGFAEKVINKLTGLVQWITKLSPLTIKIGLAFAAFAAALGPLLLLFGTALVMLPSLITGWNLMTASLAGSQIALAPMLIVMAKFIVLAGLFAVLATKIMQNWEPIKAFFADLFENPLEQIKDMFKWASKLLGLTSLFGGKSVDDKLREQGFTIVEAPESGSKEVLKNQKEEKKMRDQKATVGVEFSNLPQGAKTSTDGDLIDSISFKQGFAGGGL